jgi:hypothetical protein
MSTSSTPTLRALRETPTARIYAVGASAASLVELLGAVLGNPYTALAVLNQFPTLEDIAGIGKSSTITTKKPDYLARPSPLPCSGASLTLAGENKRLNGKSVAPKMGLSGAETASQREAGVDAQPK